VRDLMGSVAGSALPSIAITAGDPAGIGPEIAAKAAADPRVLAVCQPIVYGAPASDRGAVAPGLLSAAAGRWAFDAIVSAVTDALEGRVAAVATAPVNKEAFALAGLPWKGHTDLLAHLCRARPVAMMFHSQPLRVILATVHIPLRDVAGTLTAGLLDGVIELGATELPRLGYPSPRLALAGVNPHAGEHGLLGSEEEDVLRPAVARARAKGLHVEGPLPGDTVFVRAVRGDFDAVIACYHDQGLIPIKLLAFGGPGRGRPLQHGRGGAAGGSPRRVAGVTGGTRQGWLRRPSVRRRSG
jgi:4-hydroxy-L-threonine phosphate dehydrogenase PdxA